MSELDRRAVLTGAAAALLAAVGLGRVLVGRPATDGELAAPEGRPTPSPGTGPPSRATVPPTPQPTRTPAPEPTPTPAPEPTPSPHPSPEPAAPPALVVPVLCRDAWGARPAGAGLVPHTLRTMTVHHTAVPLTDDRQAPARLRQHQRFHQDQGWPDIAYHLGVDRRGNRYELRTVAARGDTFTDYDPTGHLLLLAEGDFDRQQPTDAQLEALAELLAWGASEHGLPVDGISGHRDHASTSCPGDALYARLPDLRARAAELATRGVGIATVCGDPARAAVARIEAGTADG